MQEEEDDKINKSGVKYINIIILYKFNLPPIK